MYGMLGKICLMHNETSKIPRIKSNFSRVLFRKFLIIRLLKNASRLGHKNANESKCTFSPLGRFNIKESTSASINFNWKICPTFTI